MEVQIWRLAQISAINQDPLSGDMLCRVSYDIQDHEWVLNFPLSALFLVSWQSLVGLLNLIMGFSDWDTCPWPLFSDALMSVKTWGNRGGMQNSELAHTGQLFPFVCD